MILEVGVWIDHRTGDLPATGAAIPASKGAGLRQDGKAPVASSRRSWPSRQASAKAALADARVRWDSLHSAQRP
jgi:hypothetical protein